MPDYVFNESFLAVEIPDSNIKNNKYLPPDKSFVAPTIRIVVKAINKNLPKSL